jgi:transcriptional regulator with XRE-family HTH domain
MSQLHLSGISGIPQPHLSRLERGGGYGPTMRTLRRWADAFDLHLVLVPKEDRDG